MSKPGREILDIKRTIEMQSPAIPFGIDVRSNSGSVER